MGRLKRCCKSSNSVGPNFGEIIPLTFRCHHEFGGLCTVCRSKSASGFIIYLQ